MLKSKKLLTISLAIALALSVAACGNSGTSSSSEAPSSSSSVTTPAPVEKTPVELSIMYKDAIASALPAEMMSEPVTKADYVVADLLNTIVSSEKFNVDENKANFDILLNTMSNMLDKNYFLQVEELPEGQEPDEYQKEFITRRAEFEKALAYLSALSKNTGEVTIAPTEEEKAALVSAQTLVQENVDRANQLLQLTLSYGTEEGQHLTAEDMEAFAIDISMMNIRAHGVAVVKPAAGKEENVKTAFENWIKATQKSFESYLQDQREIADAAKMEVLEDGTIVVVMTENQDAVYNSIIDAIKA